MSNSYLPHLQALTLSNDGPNPVGTIFENNTFGNLTQFDMNLSFIPRFVNNSFPVLTRIHKYYSYGTWLPVFRDNKFPQLRELLLQYQRLSVFSGNSLPNLEFLALTDNNLTALNLSEQCPNVIEADLTYNSLREFR